MKRKILSTLLAVCMVFTLMPMQAFATTGGEAAIDTSSVSTIQSFDKLGDRFSPSTGTNAPAHVYSLSVQLNTPYAELNLPNELGVMVELATTKPAEGVKDSGKVEEATTSTTEQKTVAVTWNSDKEYKSDVNGQFIYTAALPTGYILADGVNLPQIYVMVGSQGRGVTAANGLFAGRYSYRQVFDCQRSHTFPEAGTAFTVSSFGTPMLIPADEKKIIYFKAEPSEDNDFSLWVADDVEGSNGEAKSLQGKIYGLAKVGFLYVDTATDYGFFISNEKAYELEGRVEYTPDTLGPITHTQASEYAASTVPKFLSDKVFIIAFDPTGGSVNPRGGTTGTDSKLASLPTPTRANYSFDGWFTAASGGTAVTTDTNFKEIDKRIFAHWTYDALTITFDPTGGSVTPTSGTTGTDNKLATLPIPTRDSHRFDGWFTAASGGTEVTTDTAFEEAVTIFAHWTNIGGSSGSTGGGSGGSGGSGSTGGDGGSSGGSLLVGGSTPSPSGGTAGGTNTPGKTVIDNPVGSTGSINPLADAAKSAVAAGKASATAYVNYANYTALTKDGLKAINDAATKAVQGKDVKLDTKIQLDNKVGNVVLSRVTVDPTKLTAVMPDKLWLSVWFDQTKDKQVTAVKGSFEKSFNNKLVVVTFDQKTPLAVNMELALKPDLSGLNTKNLHFYSYNPTTNIYSRLTTPAYWVDKAGYSHITAPFGGSIIITDKPLTAK